ncbi:MAG: iron ABC transporter permease [Bdellovibrionales bacterium]|nr:iron ABC transporter permease [Bdellovibrionales bacterium]
MADSGLSSGPVWRVLALVGVAILCLLLAPFLGPVPLYPSDVFQSLTGANPATTIFWQMRVPRVMLGLLAGAGLSLAGAAFQGLFRNALATPYTLGIANGAAFGAVLCIRLNLQFNVLGLPGISLFSLIGASLSVILVYGITVRSADFSGLTMLLAGVAISLFFSSLILFVQYLTDFSQSFEAIRWLMGGLEVLGYGDIAAAAPFVAVGGGVLLFLRRELDLVSVGDDFAASRGVAVRNTRMLLFVAASLMVGGVVAVTGPIGFVGLMVPHICRLLVGPRHGVLLPVCALFGGAFLVACDCVARTIIAPAELPVGVLTALLGGPFFLWLLLRASRHGRLLGMGEARW